MSKRIPVGDFHPATNDWMERASEEYLRRHGRFRELILRMLAPAEETTEANGVITRVVRHRRRVEPSREDLIAAYHESPDPLPTPILDYVMAHYVSPQALPLKTGRKTKTRSTWDTIMIIAFYRHQLQKARRRKQAGVTANPATRAKERTAKKFNISLSTLEHLLTEDRQRRSDFPPK
jgi:hypothetical protein